MVKTYFYESFSGDFLLARAKLKNIIEYLKQEMVDLTDADLFDLRIIYNELIVNGIVHGNKKDFSKKVELIIETDGNLITSVVKDEGEGFDYSNIFKINPIDDLCEHGRGLQLVMSLVDFLEWNIAGNEVKFYKKYKGSSIKHKNINSFGVDLTNKRPM